MEYRTLLKQAVNVWGNQGVIQIVILEESDENQHRFCHSTTEAELTALSVPIRVHPQFCCWLGAKCTYDNRLIIKPPRGKGIHYQTLRGMRSDI
jgi:hypothetical protein